MTPSPNLLRHTGMAARTAQPVRRRRTPTPVRARRGPFTLRLWLPLTPLFLLLSPFPILAIPLLPLARPLRRVNSAAAVFAIGRLLLAMRGSEIDIRTSSAVIRLKIL